LTANGDGYFVGEYAGTIDFDPGVSIDNHTSSGLGDAFIVKMMFDGYW
jgi:hypothetical protein